MRSDESLITITQYSMTTARGIILQSTPFDSVEEALQCPKLCNRTQSIVIKNNKAGTSSLFAPDFDDPESQLEQKLKEVCSDDFYRN